MAKPLVRAKYCPCFLYASSGSKISWRCYIISKEQLVNEQIRAREVRLIDADGNQVGIVPFRKAMQQATDARLDLVNVAPGAKPPVCRIMDYGKFKFEQQKKEKEARKKQKVINEIGRAHV